MGVPNRPRDFYQAAVKTVDSNREDRDATDSMGEGHCDAGCFLPRRGLVDRNRPVYLGHPSYCRDGRHNRPLFALCCPPVFYFLDRNRIRWKIPQLMVLRKLETAQEVPPER